MGVRGCFDAFCNASEGGAEGLPAARPSLRGVRLQWVCRRRRSLRHSRKHGGMRLVLKSFKLVSLPPGEHACRAAPLCHASLAERILQQMPQLPPRAVVTAIVALPRL
mmetsp:Transcript_12865/g.24879  ORF Transcript_12865/g.24879 Transcript_12865/m.24879 type:complete len:108 (-) Transcript_12865:244-567(-)